MEKEEIGNKIFGIVSKIVEHDRFEIRDDLTAQDVDGWDSLTHMVIINEIEDSFGVQFRLKEINKLKNMGNLIELVQSKL